MLLESCFIPRKKPSFVENVLLLSDKVIYQQKCCKYLLKELPLLQYDIIHIASGQGSPLYPQQRISQLFLGVLILATCLFLPLPLSRPVDSTFKTCPNLSISLSLLYYHYNPKQYVHSHEAASQLVFSFLLVLSSSSVITQQLA